MPSTTWTNETIPGGAWLYNQSDITYNQGDYDGLNLLYNSTGETTSWSLESK